MARQGVCFACFVSKLYTLINFLANIALTVKAEIILTRGCSNLQVQSKLVPIYAYVYDQVSHVFVVRCSGSEFWVQFLSFWGLLHQMNVLHREE